MKIKTRGEAEVEISEAIVKFEREYMGRGPEETKQRSPEKTAPFYLRRMPIDMYIDGVGAGL